MMNWVSLFRNGLCQFMNLDLNFFNIVYLLIILAPTFFFFFFSNLVGSSSMPYLVVRTKVRNENQEFKTLWFCLVPFSKTDFFFLFYNLYIYIYKRCENGFGS